ncbi:hypothetical protein OHC50_12520 [Paenarthrobacter ilicis]|uniref:hypothetical protein n=1 Tax=Paenarthrobacter ilicis TaxID=43665 RepID=UPI00300AFB5A
MDTETVKLIVVGAFTLLAGALGSGITASVSARNSKAERMEDRFAWKREKLVDLVTDLLDISRENQEMLRLPLDRVRLKEQGSRLQRASEHVILLDSGVVARAGTFMIQAELERLSAHIDKGAEEGISSEQREELDLKCVDGRAALVSATRMILGDPTQSRYMRVLTAKTLKHFRKRGRERSRENPPSSV